MFREIVHQFFLPVSVNWLRQKQRIPLILDKFDVQTLGYQAAYYNIR